MTNTEHYTALVSLLALFSDADNRLAEMQSAATSELLETLDESQKEYAKLQASRDEAERQIRQLAAGHPEWLDGRTIKTPYGNVRFTKSTVLEIDDPDLTVLLIESLRRDEAGVLVESVKVPRKKALEALADAELAKLGVRRVVTDSIKVTPVKVDLGKPSKGAKPAVPAEAAAQ